MTKSEAIKAAYGEYWDKVKDYIDDDGWFNNIEHDFYFSEWGNSSIVLEYEGSFCRPKSLSGIETNNSWTRIESEEDLPKYNSAGDFYVMSNEGNKKLLNGGNAVRNAYRLKTITHWQLIKTKPPIF